jgi:hypothetical protein
MKNFAKKKGSANDGLCEAGASQNAVIFSGAAILIKIAQTF